MLVYHDIVGIVFTCRFISPWAIAMPTGSWLNQQNSLRSWGRCVIYHNTCFPICNTTWNINPSFPSQELYLQPYSTINWPAQRNNVAAGDIYTPHTRFLDIILCKFFVIYSTQIAITRSLSHLNGCGGAYNYVTSKSTHSTNDLLWLHHSTTLFWKLFWSPSCVV